MDTNCEILLLKSIFRSELNATKTGKRKNFGIARVDRKK